ncbi:MAG: hypothetical protein ACKO1O_00645 [Erythrobacter sp.]
MTDHPSAALRVPVAGLLDRWPVLLIVCIAATVPLLLTDFPPLTDLYGHLARYAVQTGIAQRPLLQPYFSYDWQLIGNLGGDLLVQAFHPLLGLEGAVRAVVILTQFLGALGILMVAREVHGRVTPLAFLAIPLLYGYPFNYGFINFSLSMALALLAFAAWLRLRARGRDGAALVWLGVAGAGIWVCHTFGWTFLGLLAGSTMLAEVMSTLRQRPFAAAGRILAACWALLLPLVPIVNWRAGAEGTGIAHSAFFFKMHYLVSPLRTEWPMLDVGSLGVIAAALVGLPMLGQAFALDLRLRIAALLCFACYFLMPSQIFESAFADMRLVPYAFMLGLLAITPDRIAPGLLRAVTVIAIAFCAVRLGIVGAAYVEQDRRIAATLPALDHIPEGARVAFFVVKPCAAPWPLPVLDHVGAMALVRRNAFVNDQWQRPGVNLLKVRLPAAGAFAHDPSQLVLREDCPVGTRPPLSQALAALPRGVFTNIWIVGEVPDRITPPPGFVEVPGAGSGRLYAAAR